MAASERYRLALGRLLDLTLAGREPTEKIQLTADGTRLHWLTVSPGRPCPLGGPRPA